MNQASMNEAYNLLSLACQILAKAKERSRRQSITTDITEIWSILRMLGLRPSAIGSTAAELRQMLITGHIAEARRIFMSATAEAGSELEKSRAFRDICDNLVAALRMPPPPPPLMSAPPLNDDVTCALVLMHDPFQNPPRDIETLTKAAAVIDFDGDVTMEVSQSEIQIVDNEDCAANDCVVPETAPQTLESPHDEAVVNRFFGGKDEAQKFGFTPIPRRYLSSEAILAEMDAAPPPPSEEETRMEGPEEEPMPLSRPWKTPEAVSDRAS